ncbi:MAG: alpha/beta fold hydrolase [Anaerolineales bacterium]
MKSPSNDALVWAAPHGRRYQAAGLNMAWAESGGVRVFYMHHPVEHTPGPAVLLLHGLGSCAEDWALQVAALAGRRGVIMLDLPGHGRSGRLPGWPTISGYAACALAPLDALQLERVDVVGLSLGGLVALQIGLDHPERVRSLTLVNSFARMRVPPTGIPRMLVRLILLAAAPMHALGEWVAAGIFPHPDQAQLRRMAAERLAANSRRSYLQAALAVARFDLHERLHELQLPVHVIAGEADNTVSLRAKRELARRIEGARLTIIPGSGHVSPVDAPGAFNQALLDFLNSLDILEGRG